MNNQKYSKCWGLLKPYFDIKRSTLELVWGMNEEIIDECLTFISEQIKEIPENEDRDKILMDIMDIMEILLKYSD